MSFESELRRAIEDRTQVNVKWGIQFEGSTYPFITLTQVSEVRTYYMKGDAKMTTALIQADIWSTDIDDAHRLKGNFIDLLPPDDAISLKGITLRNTRQGTSGDEAMTIYRYSIDMNVDYS